MLSLPSTTEILLIAFKYYALADMNVFLSYLIFLIIFFYYCFYYYIYFVFLLLILIFSLGLYWEETFQTDDTPECFMLWR